MTAALARLTDGGFSIGIEAPLDNDWTPAGDQARRQAGRLPGEPDLHRHAELAKLSDKLGFRALWGRDVPLYDPSFGDAAQVFEVFSYLGYPGTPEEHMRRLTAWRAVAGDRPYASFIHLDLNENADEPLQRWRFGLRGGRKALIEELNALRAAGVDHIGLQFRRNQRPLDETFHEIAEHVLPVFHTQSAKVTAPAEEICNA